MSNSDRAPRARALLLMTAIVLVRGGCNRSSKQAEMGSATKGSMDGMKGMEGMEGMAGMEGMKGMDGMRGMASSATDSVGISIDRQAAARIGITFARAAAQVLPQQTRLAGTLAYAESRRAFVSARVDGWVESLAADFTGKAVAQGEVLLALYSPTLVSAQEELLAARRLGDSALADAARRRLALWLVPPELIARVERTGAVERTVPVTAPVSGEIAEKMVSNGQAVKSGENLFLIADRRELWAELAVFERDARLLRVGMPVSVTVDAVPGRTYAGRIDFIRPALEATSRTLTARLTIRNADGQLRPGMYATASLASAGEPRLAVPLTAVLPTGTRMLVFVNGGDGRFLPREVMTGARSDSLVEIVQGLVAGDEVIASATYLLDSEANLAVAMQGLMLQMGMGLDMGGMSMEGMEGMKGMDGMKGMQMPVAPDTSRRPRAQRVPR